MNCNNVDLQIPAARRPPQRPQVTVLALGGTEQCSLCQKVFTEHWTLNTEHSGHSEHSEHSEHSVHWTPSGRVIQSSVFGWLFFSLVACTFLPWVKLFICIFCNSMFTLHWLYTVQCSCILRGYIQQILQLTWKSLRRVECCARDVQFCATFSPLHCPMHAAVQINPCWATPQS